MRRRDFERHPHAARAFLGEIAAAVETYERRDEPLTWLATNAAPVDDWRRLADTELRAAVLEAWCRYLEATSAPAPRIRELGGAFAGEDGPQRAPQDPEV